MSDPVYPWERRREGEPTSEYLARVLQGAGLVDMAQRARLYHFDDYLAPEAIDNGDNMIRLITELHSKIFGPMRSMRIAIRLAVIAGEFDSTSAESRAWMENNPQVFRDFGSPGG